MSDNSKLKRLCKFFNYGNIYKTAAKDELSEIDKERNKNMYSRLNFASSLFVFINLFYLIKEFINPTIEQTLLTIIIVSVMLVTSLIMIMYANLKKKKITASIQFVAFVYYLIIELGMFAYLYLTLSNGEANYTFIFFNYVILCICPIYLFCLNLISGLIAIAGTVTVFALNSEYLEFTDYFIAASIILISFFASNYFRINNINLYYQQIKLKHMGKTLEELSTTDFLTEIGNRTALDKFINNLTEGLKEEQKTISIMMIDIDNFKSFNDYYSHLMGDKCLRDISLKMKELCKEQYHLFRYGGEEFIILSIDKIEEDVVEFSEQIVKEVEALQIARNDLDMDHDVVTISAGLVYGTVSNADDFAYFLKTADDNLYKSKKTGKNKKTYKRIY